MSFINGEKKTWKNAKYFQTLDGVDPYPFIADTSAGVHSYKLIICFGLSDRK
jgi:hypothetical protein